MNERSDDEERQANASGDREGAPGGVPDEAEQPLPVFPGFAEAALARRRLVRELAERRADLGLSQTVVAARMGTSQSVVARLESGEVDARLSTLERYAAALGQRIEWRLSKE
jgi:hypothetical protein